MSRTSLLAFAMVAVAAGCAQTQDPSVLSHTEPDPEIAGDWQRLIQEGGCLTGSQDWSPSGLGDDTVLREPGWQRFLARDRAAVGAFLLTRLGSTGPTSHHICPYDKATEGEMAVYALQHFTHFNWIEYAGPNRRITDAIETLDKVALGEIEYAPAVRPQTLLRGILADDDARAELRAFFAARLRQTG